MAPTSDNREHMPSPAGSGREQEHRSTDKKQHIQSPVHPIYQLQGPFEESILEAIEGTEDEWLVDIDAQSRRKELLENTKYERLCGRRWRQRANERYHPLWKLTSQISFGVHLLAKGMAKSEVEVLKILQSHVDELDGFVERTTEDLSIIQIDVRTRIQYLSLPLENLDIFDEMLDDRSFRIAMIDYNDKIEHAIRRFKVAVKDGLKDIQKGKEAVGVLWHYFEQSAKKGNSLPSHLHAVYNAMLANTEGWNTALSKLRRRGKALDSALVQLGFVVTEMQRRVGVASRKDVISFTKPPRKLSRSRSIKERLFEKTLSINVTSCPPEKPLPRDPDPTGLFNTLPVPNPAGNLLRMQKSVPDLRAISESQTHGMGTKPPSRAKSVNNTTANSGSETPTLKTPRSLSRKISQSMLPRRTVSGKFDATQKRPSTAPGRALKSRSVSLEQLKSFRMNRKAQQETVSETPELPFTEKHMAQPSARHETIKNQLIHYFKSDTVIDTWENSENKKNMEYSTLKKKEWPLSMFRARSSNALHGLGGQRTTVFEKDLEQQMAWLHEESKALKTYSLKPQHDEAPRIHVLSVDTPLSEEDEEGHDDGKDGSETIRAETGSTITALPCVPPPPVSRTDGSTAETTERPTTARLAQSFSTYS